MRTGFREIQWNFSNSAKNAGFRDFRGFRGIAENRQPYVPHTILLRDVSPAVLTRMSLHTVTDETTRVVWFGR